MYFSLNFLDVKPYPDGKSIPTPFFTNTQQRLDIGINNINKCGKTFDVYHFIAQKLFLFKTPLLGLPSITWAKTLNYNLCNIFYNHVFLLSKHIFISELIMYGLLNTMINSSQCLAFEYLKGIFIHWMLQEPSYSFVPVFAIINHKLTFWRKPSVRR